MNWWEETEARAHRSKSPAGLAQTLWQRLQAAGIEGDLALLPAYDLAGLHDLCVDLVKIVDGLLLVADGERAALYRQGRLLLRWAEHAEHWCQSTAPEFNRLMDALDLDAEELEAREPLPAEEAADPEEQAKLDGRFRHWHLLYERLDLKLASATVEPPVRHRLCRSLARLYEEALVTIRLVSQLERDAAPRFGVTARRLLQVNTTWHFDLGPYHLGAGQARARGARSLGVKTLLMVALHEL
jgi:hypothetical protein